MSSTENEERVSPTSGEDRGRQMAAALFDEVVAPLAEKRRAAGSQAYFPMAPDPAVESYYVAPTQRVMAAEDFEFPGGGLTAGLIDALTKHWEAEGETELAAMGPRLKEIAAELQEEVFESDGSVDIFCYTMF